MYNCKGSLQYDMIDTFGRYIVRPLPLSTMVTNIFYISFIVIVSLQVVALCNTTNIIILLVMLIVISHVQIIF